MYEKRKINTDLKKYSEKYSNRPALIDANTNNITTYKDLWKDITSISANLSNLGVQKGDTLLALLDNSTETLKLMLACTMAGFNYAPIACSSTVYEIIKLAKLTKAKYVLAEDTINKDTINKITEFVDSIDLEHIFKSSNRPYEKYEDVGEIYIGTSGSTGEPKIIRINMDTMWSSGFNFLKIHTVINENSRFYNILPMSYLGGLFNIGVAPLSHGASIVIDQAFSGLSFLDFWQRVERFGVNALWLVPTIMRGLLKLSIKIDRKKCIDFPKVDICFVGTAPIGLDTKISFEKLTKIPVVENYGLSETLFISSETIDSNSYRKEGGVGNILPWVQMRNNLNNENSECNSILIKSPSIMDGYLKESGESDNAWFDTKDCGIINESDILILKGRSRDIIKKGGVMLNLREFEILAEKFCGAIEACAVSIKHEFYGESYILYLTSNSNINTCVHEQLSRSKWPEEIRYLSEFPRTASGKIDKIKIKMLSYE